MNFENHDGVRRLKARRQELLDHVNRQQEALASTAAEAAALGRLVDAFRSYYPGKQELKKGELEHLAAVAGISLDGKNENERRDTIITARCALRARRRQVRRDISCTAHTRRAIAASFPHATISPDALISKNL